jgi:hypothetical protein
MKDHETPAHLITASVTTTAPALSPVAEAPIPATALSQQAQVSQQPDASQQAQAHQEPKAPLASAFPV